MVFLAHRCESKNYCYVHENIKITFGGDPESQTHLYHSAKQIRTGQAVLANSSFSIISSVGVCLGTSFQKYDGAV